MNMKKMMLLLIVILFLNFSLQAQKTTSKALTKTEHLIIDTIMKLEEVKERAKYVKDQTKGKRHLQYTIWEEPSKEAPYYLVKVIEDNGISYYTHFNFYVYSKTMTIKYLDTVNDSIIDLEEWRERKKDF